MIVPHPLYREYGEDEHFDRSSSHSRYHSTRKMDFPKFDGTNPTIWNDNCEMYFEIYVISEIMKVKFAMLNFVGNAALWLKTVQLNQYIIHWEDLHKAVEIYWGKNKFNLFMRQILTIRHTDMVELYTKKFNCLCHQILLHDPNTSVVFFVERYIAGLSDELCSTVLLRLLEDEDTASMLAGNGAGKSTTTSASLTPFFQVHTSPPSDKAKPGNHADEDMKQKPPRWD
jgi:hypothetical protein